MWNNSAKPTSDNVAQFGEGRALASSFHQKPHCFPNARRTMGDYGWSMNFDTSQGIVAVEYGRVLEYPKKRNTILDHEKARSLQINRVRIGK